MVREASKQIINSERYGESSRSNIDLFSQLPNSLRIEIIRLLPTKDAVRTSVLNKRWTNLWKQIHNINFSFKENTRASLRKEFDAFERFLGNLDPSISINKFSLRFHCNPVGSHDKLDSYLSWAVEHRVKMLALDIKIAGCQRYYRVPAVLFQCQSLVELELRNGAPLDVQNASWPLLKGLNLTRTKLNAMDFNNLMESCPFLERLSLVRCEFLDHNEQSTQIRICSTTLRCLKLWECLKLGHFGLVLSLPSLVKISIDMYMRFNGARLRALLDEVSYVEEIHVGQYHMEALCMNGINKSATVKHVQVEITMDTRKRLEGMTNLLSSYPNLQTLVVNFKDVEERYIHINDFHGALDGGKALENCFSGMLNLKTIHVCGIKDADVKELTEDTNLDQIDSWAELSRKMKFKIVRILLKKLIHLEELTIYVAAKGCSYFESESHLERVTMEQLESFETAASPSPNLQVTCEPYDRPDWSAMPEN